MSELEYRSQLSLVPCRRRSCRRRPPPPLSLHVAQREGRSVSELEYLLSLVPCRRCHRRLSPSPLSLHVAQREGRVVSELEYLSVVTRALSSLS